MYKPYILDIKNNFNNYSNFDFIVKRNELLNKCIFFKKHMLTPSISVSEDDSSSVDIFTLTPL